MSDESKKPKRPHRSRQEVDQLLQAYDRSGLTQHRFAKLHGLPLSTLHYWLRRRRLAERSQSTKPTIVPVKLRQPVGSPHPSIEVSLANGRTVRFSVDTDVGRVADIVTRLDS